MYLKLKKRMQVILFISGATGFLMWALVNYYRFETVWAGLPTIRKVPYTLLLAALVLFAHKWVKLNQEEKRLLSLIKQC